MALSALRKTILNSSCLILRFASQLVPESGRGKNPNKTTNKKPKLYMGLQITEHLSLSYQKVCEVTRNQTQDQNHTREVEWLELKALPGSWASGANGAEEGLACAARCRLSGEMIHIIQAERTLRNADFLGLNISWLCKPLCIYIYVCTFDLL